MMNEFEAQVLSDLSALKTQMAALMGDGSGGKLAELERRMTGTSRIGSAPRAFWLPSAWSLRCLKWQSKPGAGAKRAAPPLECIGNWSPPSAAPALV